MLLVAFWCSLGLLFGLSWVPFWPLLGLLGCPLGSPGRLLDPSWAILGPSWACLGASCASLGLSWAIFGLLELWVAFCASLGLSSKLPWASLGLFSGLFGASPGAILALM